MALPQSYALIVVASTLFLAETSDLLLFPVKIRLLESVLCKQYYSSNDPSRLPADDSAIDEAICKIPTIQSELASIRGLQVFWDAIPGLHVI